MFHRGKKKLVPSSKDWLWTEFRDSLKSAGKLPNIKIPFGHGNDFSGYKWLMLGNGPLLPGEKEVPESWEGFRKAEGCGNCGWAAQAHRIMSIFANKNALVPPFNTETVVTQYGEYSGYNPMTGKHDEGSEMREVFERLKKIGFYDDNKKVYKVGAWVSGEPGNWEHLLEMAYVFENVNLGVDLGTPNEQQFNEEKPWELVKGEEEDGGHDVDVEGCPDLDIIALISWGRRQLASRRWVEKKSEEIIGSFSEAIIKAKTGKSPEGFTKADLEEFLHLV